MTGHRRLKAPVFFLLLLHFIYYIHCIYWVCCGANACALLHTV